MSDGPSRPFTITGTATDAQKFWPDPCDSEIFTKRDAPDRRQLAPAKAVGGRLPGPPPGTVLAVATKSGAPTGDGGSTTPRSRGSESAREGGAVLTRRIRTGPPEQLVGVESPSSRRPTGVCLGDPCLAEHGYRSGRNGPGDCPQVGSARPVRAGAGLPRRRLGRLMRS